MEVESNGPLPEESEKHLPVHPWVAIPQVFLENRRDSVMGHTLRRCLMKKWIFGLLVLALCAGPASANSIGFFVSHYSPADTSAEGGLGLDLELGSKASKVEFELRFSAYEVLLTDANPEVYRLRATPLDLGLNYNFAGGTKVAPYVGGGISYMTFGFDGDASRSTGQPRGAGIDPEIQLYVQFGLDFEISTNWKASAELVYRDVDAEVESDDLGTPLDQKVDMSGPVFNVGLAVQW